MKRQTGVHYDSIKHSSGSKSLGNRGQQPPESPINMILDSRAKQLIFPHTRTTSIQAFFYKWDQFMDSQFPSGFFIVIFNFFFFRSEIDLQQWRWKEKFNIYEKIILGCHRKLLVQGCNHNSSRNFVDIIFFCLVVWL